MKVHMIPTLFGLSEAEKLSELNAGHINRTFLSLCGGERYILQSLNSSVFHAPEAVMDNIRRIEAAFSAETDIAVPHFIACGDKNYAVADGELWRIYNYIAATADAAADAAAAGRHFGAFIRITEGTVLNKTPAIERFHDYDRYFAELSALNRTDISLLRIFDSLRDKLGTVFGGSLKKRVIHGDAKPDNVIAGSPACIIDLDTVMYSYAAIDYGDLVRSVCRDTESGLSALDSLTSGFSQGLCGILDGDEINSLYFGILWLTSELAMRYLADSQREEKYFRGKTSAECLARSRQLMAQLNAFTAQSGRINEIIHKHLD
ncbi:MAG: aminoglycoside phosphotransferase family protein [Ruminococcus sp.]|nr:aminoglycoside phosphotransferase family protein [Ruminococcus sp.]